MKSVSLFQRANLSSVCVLTLAMLFGPGRFAQAAYITNQPPSTNVLAGANASFTVGAGGTAPLRYRWSFNGTNLTNGGRISGATNATLTLSNVVAGDAGGYRVVVSNSVSVVTSAVATLTVLLPPGITTQPTNQSVPVYSNVTFFAAASGTGPLFYQWQKDGLNLTDGGRVGGATNSTLTVSDVQPGDVGNYRLMVTNVYGAATSSVATLTVLLPPSIITQPVDQAVPLSSNTLFTATAAGTAPLNFQWLFNGALLTDGGRVSGSAATNLSIANVQTNDAGTYQLVVTNNYGAATSRVATLTVLVPPGIVSQPTNQTVVLGSPATFSVTASGTTPLTCQWLLNGTTLPTNLMTTVAGNGTAGYAGDGGAAWRAMLNSPNGVALDTDHNVFIADTSNHRIRKMDTNGIITTVAGNGTNGFSGDGSLAINASLNSPGHIVFDSAGNLFIADTANHRIRKVDVNGLITTVAGAGTNGYSGDGGPATNASLNSPGGIAFDSAGNLFIADMMNSRVRKVDTNNVITTVAGNGSSAWPTTGDGGPATNAIIRYPASVAADAAGNLFVGDAGDNRVRKVDINGIITTFAGGGPTYYSGDGGPATNASLWTPVDLCFDASGSLFIDDVYNNRIRKVDTNGIITTVAGLQSWVYNGDNMAATSTTLYFPFGVAVDAAGNLFIADTGNHRIREVEITTYPTLTLNGVTANLAGDFQVIISNVCGSVTSSTATLTVLLPPAIVTQPINQYVLLGGSAAFAVAATGDAPLSYAWQLNGIPLSDDSRLSGTATNRLTVQNIQAADAGPYQVVITNAWGVVTSSIANLVIATARYVNASNPSPVAPYTSWATAATVIQDAIDTANVGDWILVSNGVYRTGGRVVQGTKWNRVVMTNQVTVIAVNGPRVTTIVGDVPPNHHTYGTRCAWLGSGSTLSGFTISGGGNYLGNYQSGLYDDGGGGVYCESSSALVTSCIISGNSGCVYGGGVNGGTLVNCLLTANTALTYNQSTIYYWGTGGGAYFSSLLNCTVVANSAYFGGGLAYCSATNCIVYYSSSGGDGFYAGFVNSCSTGLQNDSGNTTNEPLFLDLAGGNYHLQSTSPCVDTGLNVTTVGNADLDGFPRVVNGTVDMGAYEYQHLPYILVPPVSQSVLVFSNILFTVTALGDEPLTYQWQKDGVNLSDDARISGTASPFLSISSLEITDAGGYRVVVTNASGSVTSAVAALTLVGPPIISSQPASRTVFAGSNVSFSVTASGLAALSYQWRFNQAELPAKTNSSVSLTDVQSANAGNYDVVVTNFYGAITSSVATLSVLSAAPIITTQAVSRVVSVGQTAAFTVSARGTEPMFCQWQFNGTNLPGAGGFTLGLTNVNASFTGTYRAAVSNSVDVASTTNITLTVSPVLMWGLTNPPQTSGPLNSLIPASATNVIAIAAGSSTELGLPCMALRADGTLATWGYSSRDPAPPTNAVDLVAISVGSSSSQANNLVLRADGNVVNWTTSTKPLPAAVTNGNIVAVAAGGLHQLALRDDGTVFAWGSNNSGQTNVPPGATNVIAIAAGTSHSLALRADGTVVGWGLNTSGQATALSNFVNVVAIAAAGNQSMGLLADGTVVGRIVTNTPGAAVLYGPPTGNTTNKISIAAGLYHSLAINADRTVSGWGATNYGQLTAPPYATNVRAIAAGGNDSLALVRDPFAPPIPPRIGRPPLGRTLKAGDNTVFNALAVGGLPLRYQWYFNGSLLAGQTNRWLGLTNAHPSQAGDYQLVAMNDFGSCTSAVATVSVTIPAPVLTSASVTTGGFHFGFNSVADVIYIVEYRNDLNTGGWLELERRFGAGGLEIVTDASASGPKRFYRVRALYAPAPQLAAATLSGGSVNFGFATVNGAQYVVECTGQLAPPDWHEVRTISGTGGAIICTNSTLAAPQMFFRLRVR